ncbi:MAG: hypothetical protein ABJK25_12365 [Halieaceae bacterium]
MEAVDYLYTCAEIGVALSGFAALVVAIGQKSRGDSNATDIWYVNVIIERGLVAALLAMLPILLDGLGVPQNFLWSICSGLFAIYIFTLAWRSYRTRVAWKDDYPVMSSGVFSILMLLGLCVMVLLIFHAFGIFLEQSSWWYVLGVTWLLVSLGYVFLMFLRSVFIPSKRS